MYKMRTYHKTGTNKGNLDKEIFYNSYDEMMSEYCKLWKRDNFSLNPTIWKLENNEYIRITGVKCC